RYAAVPLPAVVTSGLGQRWHTETFSVKRYPGSEYAQAPVECAAALHRHLGRVAAEDVEEVVVYGSIFTAGLAHVVSEHLDMHDPSPISVSFSVGYGVATALMTGCLTTADLGDDCLCDEARWALADKVRVEHDLEPTQRAVLATA